MWLEGQDKVTERRQLILRAAVAGRWADPKSAWPDIFAVPEDDGQAVPVEGADLSDFTWETPTAQSAESDLEALMQGARVTMPAVPDPAAGKQPPPFPPPPPEAPETALRPGAPVQEQQSTEWL